jgi:hypothetical protein
MDRTDLVRTLAAMTDDEYRDVTTEARGDADPRTAAAQIFRDLLNPPTTNGTHDE